METELISNLRRIYKEVHKQFNVETFEDFCEAMCATDLLKPEEKTIIHKLITQWRMNRGEK